MDNKTIINAYSERLWNQKDLSVIDETIAAQVVMHSPLRDQTGIEEFKKVMGTWLEALPDMHVTWEDTICEGNKVVSRWRAEGTHKAPLVDIPATNKHVKYSGITIYSLENGKVKEYWAIADIAAIKQKLLDE